MNKLIKITLISAIMATSGFAAESTPVVPAPAPAPVADTASIAAGASMTVQGQATVNIPMTIDGVLSLDSTGKVENNNVIMYGKTGSLSITLDSNSKFADGTLKAEIKNIYDKGTTTAADFKLSALTTALNDGNWKFNDGSASDGSEVHTWDGNAWTGTDGSLAGAGHFLTNTAALTPTEYFAAIKSLAAALTAYDIEITWTRTANIASNFYQNSNPVTTIDTTDFDKCNPTEGILDLSQIDNTATGTFSGYSIGGGTVKLSHRNKGKFTDLFAGMDTDRPIVVVYQYNPATGAEEVTTVLINKGTTEAPKRYILPQSSNTPVPGPMDQLYDEFANVSDLNLNPVGFNGHVPNGSNLTATPGVYLFADPASDASGDNRNTFIEVVLDATLNAAGNIFSTDNMLASSDTNYANSAIKLMKEDANVKQLIVGKSKTSSENVPEITFNLEGPKEASVKFGGYEVAETNNTITSIDYNSSLTVTSLTFSGNNLEYKGEAGVDSKVEKVIANGANALPQRLAADFENTVLEIVSGANAVNADSASTTTVKSLTLTNDQNAATSLTIGANKTLIIGAAPASTPGA